jgi:hypothetical protein
VFILLTSGDRRVRFNIHHIVSYHDMPGQEYTSTGHNTLVRSGEAVLYVNETAEIIDKKIRESAHQSQINLVAWE